MAIHETRILASITTRKFTLPVNSRLCGELLTTKQQYHDAVTAQPRHGFGAPDQWLWRTAVGIAMDTLQGDPALVVLQQHAAEATADRVTRMCLSCTLTKAFNSSQKHLRFALHPMIDVEVGGVMARAIILCGGIERTGTAPAGAIERNLAVALERLG